MSNSEQSTSATERCSNCGDEITDQPLYPARDVEPGEAGLTYADDPDGPFCNVDCRRDYDDQ